MSLYTSVPKLGDEIYRAQLKDGTLCIVTTSKLIRWGSDGPYARVFLFEIAEVYVAKIDWGGNYVSNESGRVVCLRRRDWTLVDGFRRMEFESTTKAHELAKQIRIAMIL